MNIPDFCFTLNNMTINPQTGEGSIIKIKALEDGYYNTHLRGTQETVNKMNSEIGVTRAQEEAMSAGSMFGWQVYSSVLQRYQEIFEKSGE